MQNIKFLVLLCFCPLALNAQTKPILRLDSIFNRIAKANPMLQSYQKQAESYQYAADAATAWMAPMFGFGTYMFPYPGQMLMNPNDKGSLMFQLEQELPRFGKQKKEKQYIQSKSELSKLDADILYNEYRYQARLAVFSWLNTQDHLKVLAQNKQLLKLMKSVEEARLTYNQSKPGMIYQLDGKIAEMDNQERALLAEQTMFKAKINTLMNRSSETDFELSVKDLPQFTAVNTANKGWVLARKDIQKMEQDIQSMRLNLAVLADEKKPSFRIRYDHMSPLGSGMPKAFSLMGMVSIPIVPWAAKMYKAEGKAMRLELEAKQLEKDALLLEGKNNAMAMKVDIEAMQKQINTMEQSVLPALEKSMELNLLNYRENKLDLLAVLAAWEAVVMMQNNLLAEQLKLYNKIAEYDKEWYR